MIKVLDVGGSDGYLSYWLSQRFKDVVIEGVDPDPQAALRARKRGLKWHDGTINDLPADALYDFVVAFEVIEHAADPDAFLSSLEAHCRGQVVISTPDGTFGSGRNPQHLHCWNISQLVELIRTRGQITQAAVGEDGIAFISYIPGKRLKRVDLYLGPTVPWSPRDMETKGLGGSETAAARVAEHLESLGDIVTIYGNVERGMFGQTVYRPWEEFDPSASRDIFISSRRPDVFSQWINAPVRALWVHDIHAGEIQREWGEQITHVLGVSRWHAEQLKQVYPGLRGKIHAVRNGIDLPAITPRERKPWVVSSSSPDRGLDHLLTWWPEIRARVPDAELHYCYGPAYEQFAQMNQTVRDHMARCQSLESEGVVNHRSLPHRGVLELMRSSMVWAHPSWSTPVNTPFHETSCIGAMEAQAMGCHVVASNWGALSDTVQVGSLVEGGGPADPRWSKAFIEEIVRGLTNRETQEHSQVAGPHKMRDMGWRGVALQIHNL